MANSKEREIVRESKERVLRLLEKLNSSPSTANSEGKEAEQYHQLLSALYDCCGVQMIQDAEEDRENGAAYRGASYGTGGAWSGHFDPYLHGGLIYRNGGSYGHPETWDRMDMEPGFSGASGPRRDSMGRFSGATQRGGGSTRRGGSYGDDMAARLEAMMETAPASERRHFEKVLDRVEAQG